MKPTPLYYVSKLSITLWVMTGVLIGQFLMTVPEWSSLTALAGSFLVGIVAFSETKSYLKATE